MVQERWCNYLLLAVARLDHHGIGLPVRGSLQRHMVIASLAVLVTGVTVARTAVSLATEVSA